MALSRPTCEARPTRFRAFRRSESGATAVEFGMLALPFLLLMFSILEIAMLFWSTQVLETAVANASRKIYTGQFQSDAAHQNKTSAQLAAAFKASLCSNVTALFDCNQVAVDIRSVSGFSGAAPPSAVKTTGTTKSFDASEFGYQTVGAKQIAVVTAALEYPALVPMLKTAGGLSNGNRVIMATAAFRTEPYTP
ncbi:TadE/TadG family type IV pilus assembly protein [Enterovirga sp.]|jgi:Flp pilus assembly protein TadG|uniref:TadE/TadG family type IV pilus assembly protein n=1 Tax=Enterovirga sp. TaxID=2026350 RepID=UPI0026155D91|nr:TadE/TadG family type IV pilus assembly protein [Enterovirga sp.]MDB5589511.1 pilus assembly protein TadG [Enterovirga sp.]